MFHIYESSIYSHLSNLSIFSLSISMYLLSIHPPIIYLFYHLSTIYRIYKSFIYSYLSIHLSPVIYLMCLSIHPSVYLSMYLSIHPSFYLSVSLSIHPSIYPSITCKIYIGCVSGIFFSPQFNLFI